jgi:hypothetical protein
MGAIRAPGSDAAAAREGPQEMTNLTTEQRDALKKIAESPHGLTEDLLVSVHLFNREMLAGLLDAGLVIAHRHTGKAGGKTIEVVRLGITETGREALKTG